MAELIAAVHVKDPERPSAAAVLFRPGDEVPERFWPGMTNPLLWKDGEVPGRSKEDGRGDDGVGNDGTDSTEPELSPAEQPEPKKPAARKAAAPKTGSRRQAAAEGTGGQ